MCHWINICEKKWEDEDHLNQIANIRKDQIRKIQIQLHILQIYKKQKKLEIKKLKTIQYQMENRKIFK